jgi:hypothetical protein
MLSSKQGNKLEIDIGKCEGWWVLILKRWKVLLLCAKHYFTSFDVHIIIIKEYPMQMSQCEPLCAVLYNGGDVSTSSFNNFLQCTILVINLQT